MSTEFLQAINAECVGQLDDAPDTGFRLTTLGDVLLTKLEESGVIPPPTSAFFTSGYKRSRAEVHAYAADLDTETIQLIYLLDDGINWEAPESAFPVTTNTASINKAFKHLENFVEAARDGKITNVDESDPVHELVEMLRDTDSGFSETELIVITTGTATFRETKRSKSEAAELGGRRVFDLVYLSRVCDSGSSGGAVRLDFVRDYGGALPCLVAPITREGIQVVLACMPGNVLADIYSEYRTAVLERNVRCFLQLRGKVNKGIRETALNKPEMLLAYNNGISATADEVDLVRLGDGSIALAAVNDFQIVNGGQTTATIALCQMRDNADVSSVRVAMKLSVVPPAKISEVVPLISRCANTQNKVQDADFSANHEWHIGIEKISRELWTAPSSSAPRGTRWFYERSNGQYNDGLAQAATPAARKRFQKETPSSQKITKTDAAKYLLGWHQFPFVVARGAQKAFAAFMEADVPYGPSDGTCSLVAAYKTIVALALVHKRIEKLYKEMGYQGYRSQVVTYAVARLSVECDRSLDVDRIWREQAVPPTMLSKLKILVPAIRECITNPPSSQRNISEWAKKEGCWEKVLELRVDLACGVEPAEAEDDGAAQEPVQTSSDRTSVADAVQSVPSDVWFGVAQWAKQHGKLRPWQRSLAFSLGRYASLEKMPSLKQAVQGRILLLAIIAEGFEHERLSEDVVAMVSESVS